MYEPFIFVLMSDKEVAGISFIFISVTRQIHRQFRKYLHISANFMYLNFDLYNFFILHHTFREKSD